MHPRVRGFLLFLLYAVVSNALGAVFGWLFILKLHAVDISDFEGAGIIVDLNEPLPPHLEATCDLLVDGSTLDNIFNPTQGLRNLARMLKPGGRLFLSNMANSSRTRARARNSPAVCGFNKFIPRTRPWRPFLKSPARRCSRP